MNASERAAQIRASRQPAPIPVPGTDDYTAYRGGLRPSQPTKRQPVMTVPQLDLLPECPVTGSRFATHRDWIEALWETGVLNTVDIAEIIGSKTTEAYVCGVLSELREARHAQA